jgi:hypothetical protein
MRQPQQTGSAAGWILIVLVVVIGALGGYWYYIPSDRPWWVTAFMPDFPASQNTQMYKWKDAGGRWQYSNTKPPEGVAYETVEYVENVNVIPADPDRQD